MMGSPYDDADLQLMLDSEFGLPTPTPFPVPSTVLLEYVGADSLIEVCTWANTLPGQRCADYPSCDIVGVMQFQVVPRAEKYDALVLVVVRPR
jgi:hypothetical protein